MPELAASSLKAALDLDWDDPAALQHALGVVLTAVGRVEQLAAELGGGQDPARGLAAARQVADQDTVAGADGVVRLRQGVARDRRISIEDAQMRHGRKTKSVRIDGYKRHVLCDLDTELVASVGVTAANVAEAEVASQIEADLEAQGLRLGELHLDRAYLASSLVRDRDQDLEVFCKAFPVRNGPRFAKTAFALDLDSYLVTCPNHITMPFTPGGKVQFPASTCQACPLRTQCTTSLRGRSVQVHPDEALLVELRAAQQTPQGRARLRQRVTVEHTLAHLGRWQGRRARYLASARTCSTCPSGSLGGGVIDQHVQTPGISLQGRDGGLDVGVVGNVQVDLEVADLAGGAEVLGHRPPPRPEHPRGDRRRHRPPPLRSRRRHPRHLCCHRPGSGPSRVPRLRLQQHQHRILRPRPPRPPGRPRLSGRAASTPDRPRPSRPARRRPGARRPAGGVG